MPLGTEVRSDCYPQNDMLPFVLVLSVNIFLLTLKGQQHAEEQVHGPQNVQALNEKFSKTEGDEGGKLEGVFLVLPKTRPRSYAEYVSTETKTRECEKQDAPCSSQRWDEIHKPSNFAMPSFQHGSSSVTFRTSLVHIGLLRNGRNADYTPESRDI